MQELLISSTRKINDVQPQHQRPILQQARRDAQLNVILGLRGVGKTTFLLQEAKKFMDQHKSVLYISLDDFYFLNHHPMQLIEQYHAEGGEYLFIDEVHYYEHWSRLLKRTFDTYPRLKVWATGSSAVKVYEGKADLARRGHFYIMPGLSFREYAQSQYKNGRPQLEQPYTLEEIIENRMDIANDLRKLPGIRKVFHQYLQVGYFPFALDDRADHLQLLRQTIQSIFDSDMKVIKEFDLRDGRQTLSFLTHIAASVPYKFNVSNLAKKIGLPRNKLTQYIYLLEQADLVYLLNDQSESKSSYAKPEKIYLSNSNMYYALNPSENHIGSVREAFAMNQLIMSEHEVSLHPTADFLVNNKYAIEIGGKSKNLKQIAGLEHGYIFADNLEVAYGKRLPLWMLGLMY